MPASATFHIVRSRSLSDEELLDYCDERGMRLGTATRREVHARGLWHRTLHLWLATPDEGGSLLYQLRSATAASWPGRLDATVAGHLLAGEGHREALRETREEIGIAVPADVPVLLGERREDHADPAGGWNREIQGVHLARLDPAWGEPHGLDGEAGGLVRIGLQDGLALHGGEARSIMCDAVLFTDYGNVNAKRLVQLEDFVPRHGYYSRMHKLAAELIRGVPAARLIRTHDEDR